MPTVYPDGLTLKCDVTSMYDGDGGDRVQMIERVQRPGVVNSVELIPNWSLNGANTDSRTYTLYNRGQAGAGTAVVAQLALTSGVNLTKFVSKAITLSATGANRVVAAGDVLEWESLHVGAGLPDPGGQVIVQQSFAP
jgi:hypothetical protein